MAKQKAGDDKAPEDTKAKAEPAKAKPGEKKNIEATGRENKTLAQMSAKELRLEVAAVKRADNKRIKELEVKQQKASNKIADLQTICNLREDMVEATKALMVERERVYVDARAARAELETEMEFIGDAQHLTADVGMALQSQLAATQKMAQALQHRLDHVRDERDIFRQRCIDMGLYPSEILAEARGEARAYGVPHPATIAGAGLKSHMESLLTSKQRENLKDFEASMSEVPFIAKELNITMNLDSSALEHLPEDLRDIVKKAVADEGKRIMGESSEASKRLKPGQKKLDDELEG